MKDAPAFDFLRPAERKALRANRGVPQITASARGLKTAPVTIMKSNHQRKAPGGRHSEPAAFHGHFFSGVTFPLGFLLI